MRAKAALNCEVSSWLYSDVCQKVTTRDLRRYSQTDQSRLKTVLQEYPFFPFRPLNVVLQYIDLDLLTIRDGHKEVKKGSDWSINMVRFRIDSRIVEKY